ncbi:MAG: preprotein translocase subunit SecY [Verrucomicrobia bacterium]|nr:preprotein translocase subunit SecY [Verrucomicrobiota bacterium]MBO4714776.1 preprotein translocase subunit SecY [Verrucomicrobiota bacterium]MBQ7589657.1 preprotein translocase subunit SecY [Verrucomicrobiota bacterium]MBR5606177.1 preprotein translocase subunit SecY [Verrucomicrobiota bacterium]MBR5691596.1 preprotein translocase subunit SecY [Verrucomicrobiota bacterium]
MLKNIVNTFANCFKIPELRSRIFFTLIVLGICRLAAIIPLPGLDSSLLKQYFDSHADVGGGLLGMYSMFTGGALERCAVGTLGIMPYISATIVLQLLTAVVGKLSRLAREAGGRIKIIQYGRVLTVLLCLGQGFVMALAFEHPGKLFSGFEGNLVLVDNLWWYRIQTAILLTTGTVMLMWLGEQITERGIGNGISLIITIGILSRIPLAAQGVKDMFFTSADSQFNMGHMVLMIVLMVVVVASVIAITQAQRKIPVQYAQRTVGRKSYAGTTSFLPLRVNYAGVMPIIFAQALLMFPATIFTYLGSAFEVKLFNEIARQLHSGQLLYLIVYAAMVIFFTYFWVATQFNELQISDDLKKNGGYIPGVRPGQVTCDFLHHAMSRLTLAGAIFLTIIAIIPMTMYGYFKIDYNVASFFGGTSILILVGVVLDTMRQIESHLMMRHYDGFLKKGRIRGRF